MSTVIEKKKMKKKKKNSVCTEKNQQEEYIPLGHSVASSSGPGHSASPVSSGTGKKKTRTAASIYYKEKALEGSQMLHQLYSTSQ